MIFLTKNKYRLYTLKFDEFYIKCSLGKKGITNKKVEGDKKTPAGKFRIGSLFYRKDRIQKPKTRLRCIPIQPKMGWSNDSRFPNKYNKLINTQEKMKHEKLFRKDYKYDLLIPIEYNYHNAIPGKGSCIFIHLTRNYKPTAGCIAINKIDFFVLLKIINTNTKIKI